MNRPHNNNGFRNPPMHALLPGFTGGAVPLGQQGPQAAAVAVVNTTQTALVDTHLLMLVAAACPGEPAAAVGRAIDIVIEVIESGMPVLNVRLAEFQERQQEKARLAAERERAGLPPE